MSYVCMYVEIVIVDIIERDLVIASCMGYNVILIANI